MPLQPRGRKNVLIGLSSIFLASLLAAGGMVERTARGTTVRMPSVNLNFAYPTPTVQPTIPVVVQKKADAPRSVVEPPKHEAAVSAPPPPVLIPTISPVAPPVVGSTTLATHYRAISPSTCWDPAPHDIKQTRMFVAMRGVPCKTLVTIQGAIGSITVPVVDHGPNCSCPERGLDASNDVFAAVIGPLSQGVGQVRWHFG